MEGGVDVVRTGFERLYVQSLRAEGGEQTQHQRGLAGARGGGGNEEAGNVKVGRGHLASGKRGSVPTGRNRRS
jgi:hypothetical protein